MNMIKYVVFSLLLLGIPVIGQGQDVKINDSFLFLKDLHMGSLC